MNYDPNDFRQEYKDFFYTRDLPPSIFLDNRITSLDEFNDILRMNQADFRIGPLLLPDGDLMPIGLGVYKTKENQNKYFDGDGHGRPVVERKDKQYRISLEKALHLLNEHEQKSLQ